MDWLASQTKLKAPPDVCVRILPFYPHVHVRPIWAADSTIEATRSQATIDAITIDATEATTITATARLPATARLR